jgi:hypothetical protein
MDEAASEQNLFNALYPFKSGNLPRTLSGAIFTRSVYFMTSCREEMRLNWQCRGPHSVHQQWLNRFNDWRRQAIRAVESMEAKLDKPHRRAKRFIRSRPAREGEQPIELIDSIGEQGVENEIMELERGLDPSNP